MAVEQRPDFRQRAGGQQSATADEEDAIGQRIHFFEDVAGYQDRLALRRQRLKQRDQFAAADWDRRR